MGNLAKSRMKHLASKRDSKVNSKVSGLDEIRAEGYEGYAYGATLSCPYIEAEYDAYVEGWKQARLEMTGERSEHVIVEKHVFQDGRDFYVGTKTRTEQTVTAPMRANDFDMAAAADARDWFVKIWCARNNVKPLFEGETF